MTGDVTPLYMSLGEYGTEKLAEELKSDICETGYKDQNQLADKVVNAGALGFNGVVSCAGDKANGFVLYQCRETCVITDIYAIHCVGNDIFEKILTYMKDNVLGFAEKPRVEVDDNAENMKLLFEVVGVNKVWV